MENQDKKIIEISEHSNFVAQDNDKKATMSSDITKMTNPIAKNFTKFVQRTKDKFSLKDIIQ